MNSEHIDPKHHDTVMREHMNIKTAERLVQAHEIEVLYDGRWNRDRSWTARWFDALRRSKHYLRHWESNYEPRRDWLWPFNEREVELWVRTGLTNF